MTGQPRPTAVATAFVFAFSAGFSVMATAAPTIILNSATGNTCVYGSLATDSAGNITVTCTGQPDGIITVTPARIAEGAAASIHLDCGSNTTNQLYLTATGTGAGSDTMSWTNGTQVVLNCAGAPKTADLNYTAARNTSSDPDRDVALALTTAASGGGTVKAGATLTVTDDMAMLNALAAPLVWANTDTAMTVTGALGVPATAGRMTGSYGDLYVDATGKWTYIQVPGRGTVAAGTATSDPFANVGGTGKAVSITVVGAAVGSAPGAPSIGTASQATSTSISVAFTPAQTGSAATAYDATCTSSNGGAQGTGSGSSTPVTVGSLTTDKTYSCTVVARNSAGSSTASAVSNPVTLSAAPSIPNTPTIGTAAQATSTSINVAFTPAQTGPAATAYDATCTSSDGGAQGTGSGSGTPVTVGSLTTGKTYNCTVVARNSAGSSQASVASNAVVLNTCASTFGGGNDTDWNMQTWQIGTLFPNGPIATISASGDAGTAIRFTAAAGSNGITLAGVKLDYQAVTGTTEAVVSACPHDFTTPAYGTAADQQACYISYSGNVGNIKYLTFDGTHVNWYDCPLNTGQTYYLNLRPLTAPRGTVTNRINLIAR